MVYPIFVLAEYYLYTLLQPRNMQHFLNASLIFSRATFSTLQLKSHKMQANKLGTLSLPLPLALLPVSLVVFHVNFFASL